MTTNLTNNEMKSELLESIGQLTNSLKSKVTVLDALDRDNESGRFDLHDQLTTFHELAESLAQVVKRSLAIVPGGLEKCKNKRTITSARNHRIDY
mgnify:FL=1|jgi:hypothetical protein|tara:strand:+ start:404 stop:688 length:285 start_codon:yes stop_codon:yes gene_type:complete